MALRSRTASMWWGLAIEAPDPSTLARFYASLLDWTIVHEEPGTTVVQPTQESMFIVFQQADGYTRPVWPPREEAQRPMMHLDIEVDDLDIAVADALTLGACLADHQPHNNVRVLFDPDGHPFCLCLDDGD